MSEHVYKVVELVGTSGEGIEGAIQAAVRRADETLRNLRWFEVMQIARPCRRRRGPALSGDDEGGLHPRQRALVAAPGARGGAMPARGLTRGVSRPCGFGAECRHAGALGKIADAYFAVATCLLLLIAVLLLLGAAWEVMVAVCIGT